MSIADIIIIIFVLVCIAVFICVKIIKRKTKNEKQKSECKGCPFCDDCQKYYVGCDKDDCK